MAPKRLGPISMGARERGAGIAPTTVATTAPSERMSDEQRMFRKTCSVIFNAVDPNTGTPMFDVIQNVERSFSVPRDSIRPAIWYLLSPDTVPVDGRWLSADWNWRLRIKKL